jgi:hypothetical protein
MIFEGVLFAAILGIYGYLFKIERRLTKLETISTINHRIYIQNSLKIKGETLP